MDADQLLSHQIRVVDASRRVVCAEGRCWQQAKFNKEHAYRQLGLKFVVGSLGMGKTSPFFEFGGEAWDKVKTFKKTAPDMFGRTQWDVHVWLENDAGGIYDVVSWHVIGAAAQRSKVVDFSPGHVIEGLTRDALAARGLVYVAAPELVQRVILHALEKEWSPEYDFLVVPIAFGKPARLADLATAVRNMAR
jgi:hypothetical protein